LRQSGSLLHLLISILANLCALVIPFCRKMPYYSDTGTGCACGGEAGGPLPPPPQFFGRSVNPFPTGGEHIIPTYYYCPPPQFFTFLHHCTALYEKYGKSKDAVTSSRIKVKNRTLMNIKVVCALIWPILNISFWGLWLFPGL
jgi:hypothetical protein